jgi:hypothetical protein
MNPFSTPIAVGGFFIRERMLRDLARRALPDEKR